MRVGDYVYNIVDKQKKNLLILKIKGVDFWVYDMKTNDKFWISKWVLKKTPIPWKNK